MPNRQEPTDDRSFAEVYERSAPGLRRFAMARTRDQSLAEDVVQEAFMRLVAEERAGRTPANREAWLHRVTLNLIISGSRRAVVARRRSLPVSIDDVTSQSPEDIVLEAERDHAIDATLLAASPAVRRSLVLAAHGYSGREIARSIGRSECATRALMCRARRDLRRELEGVYLDVA